jgi:hypothetical protein
LQIKAADVVQAGDYPSRIVLGEIENQLFASHALAPKTSSDNGTQIQGIFFREPKSMATLNGAQRY